jgi:endoglucanase Acf2
VTTPRGAVARRVLAPVAVGSLATLCAAWPGAAAPPVGAVALGRAAYYTTARGPLGPDERPPVAGFRSGEALGKAVPTNQWYSSLMFERWSYPIHAHPMTYRASEQGFELGLPDRRAASPDALEREILYPHVAAITVAPLGFTPEDARLAQFSDWLIQVRMGTSDGRALTATVLHGSPFSYFECPSGDVRFRLAARPELIADPRAAAGDPRVLAVTIAGHSYGLFAPTAARWEWTGATELVLHLPARARYFSVAGLPDRSPATVRDFLAVAYAFPTGTRADWSYDERASTVRTRFRVETVAREGENRTTFMGLYPHQWSAVSPQPASKYRYDSVRGPIRLVAGNRFSVQRVYHGFVPLWPGLEDPAHRASVDRLLGADVARSDELFLSPHGRGSYWTGKALGATAQLLGVAEAQGRSGARDALLGKLERRLEAWFDGRHPSYFLLDATLGTFVALPQEFHSYQSMNDHHFHYGYWLTGAAHVALRDPAWATPPQWGGIVGKIIADIATDERGRPDFPFLRNFDAYEGHSWAAGTAAGEPAFEAGNNQESSSEAVNAWAGLILWGEATGNRRLRDLGIYLYTTEIASVQQYWFDLDHQVLGPDFGKPFAVQVFGGKFAYNTWWTEEPHQMYGINMLPLTPASTYLGADPAYLRSIFALLPAEERRYQRDGRRPPDPPPADVWQDALAACLALADPDAALRRWNEQGSVESGETRSHTLFWLLSLAEMGRPDFSVTADTPLYAVFKDAKGARTYLAYNARDTALRVSFSSGKVLDVAPHSLARSH